MPLAVPLRGSCHLSAAARLTVVRLLRLAAMTVTLPSEHIDVAVRHEAALVGLDTFHWVRLRLRDDVVLAFMHGRRCRC